MKYSFHCHDFDISITFTITKNVNKDIRSCTRIEEKYSSLRYDFIEECYIVCTSVKHSYSFEVKKKKYNYEEGLLN